MTDVDVVRFCRQCMVGWPAAGEPSCVEPGHQHEQTEVHRHRTPVALPDGTVITAVSFDARDPYDREHCPDFGLYLDRRWEPPWEHAVLEWPDFGTPADVESLIDALADLWRRARSGQHVELGCLGGHGRTGTAMAILVVTLGIDRTAAVGWVREHYCAEAVETDAQAQFVADAPIR